ncbi:MAG: hypothetical protein WD114_00500, partial [Phycisphaerales bacterium]
MAISLPQHDASEPAAVRPTPLWAVLTLTFLGSLGTGAVTNGFSFIATEGLGYGRRMNLLMALALGATYILGALASGPIVQRLRPHPSGASPAPGGGGGPGEARVGGGLVHAHVRQVQSPLRVPLTPRGLLAIILALIGIACLLPILAQRFAPSMLEAALWALILIFSPMTGMLWPIVEGYLSGGRRGKALRSAIGRFNIVWSGALVVAFWGMAPLLADHPFVILALLGVAHWLMCGLLFWFPAHPPRELHNPSGPAPAEYVPLLTLFRVLLIASYIVLSALSPLLPIVEDKLGVDVYWKTPLASAWLTSRVLVFAVFERWHGWHGRWWAPWTGMGLMLAGFAGCIGAPMVPGFFPGIGVAVLIASLVITGAGIAITYYGALYYALAVGDAQVDAGGKHEAMIGMGYTLGPLCGLAGLGLSEGDDDAFRVWIVLLVTGAVVLFTLLGWALLRRLRRRA